MIPEALVGELFDKLTAYYDGDPNVTVIVERRRTSRRESPTKMGGARMVRDRRRSRVTGELPDAPPGS